MHLCNQGSGGPSTTGPADAATPTQRAACRLFAQMFSGWLSYVPLLKVVDVGTAKAAAV